MDIDPGLEAGSLTQESHYIQPSKLSSALVFLLKVVILCGLWPMLAGGTHSIYEVIMHEMRLIPVSVEES